MVEPLMEDLIGGLFFDNDFDRCHYVLMEGFSLYFYSSQIGATDSWRRNEFTLHGWHKNEHNWK